VHARRSVHEVVGRRAGRLRQHLRQPRLRTFSGHCAFDCWCCAPASLSSCFL
jgi:hypothetical protein